MFGLMKISTHEKELQKVIDELGADVSIFQYFNDHTAVQCAALMKRNYDRRVVEINSLKARIVKLEAKLLCACGNKGFKKADNFRAATAIPANADVSRKSVTVKTQSKRKVK
jgi:hypothetical protein